MQPSHYEILVGGRKLIGSAQLRRKGVMLQHGTIPICGDAGRICQVLKFTSAAERAMHLGRTRQRALTLAQALGRAPAWNEVATALERGFVDAFALDMRPGQLSAAEASEAERLIQEQFGNPDWTAKR